MEQEEVKTEETTLEPEQTEEQKTLEPEKKYTDEDVDKILSRKFAKWQQKKEEEMTEAQKLAEMTAQEKTQYESDKKAKQIEERERAVTKRELMAEAKNTLADKGLPADLAELLNYEDAEACNQSIEAISSAFQATVQKSVEEKLKGKAPLQKAPDTEPNDYASRLTQARKGNDKVAVIQIKQEAAEKGIILM